MGITPSHDLNLPQSTAYQTHFKQLNLKSIIMSDAARKGFGEQAQEKLTPQSQKSTGQVIGENLTGAGDKVAAAVQPSSEKSTTQKAGDSVRGSGDSAQKECGGMLDSVSKTVTDTVNSYDPRTWMMVKISLLFLPFGILCMGLLCCLWRSGIAMVDLGYTHGVSGGS